jgi:hypothetical protein
VFRFGQIRISEADFQRIAAAMGRGERPEQVSPGQAALV